MKLTTRLINPILRRVWTGQFAQKPCAHLAEIRENAKPEADVCLACVATGDKWPGLRMCLTCGHVGCCNKAKNQHALKHFQATGHPLVRPHREPGMHWIWCFVDEAMLDPLD